MQTEKRSLLHIEIIRIIAAFFVIFNHTGNYGFSLFTQYPPDSVRYWVYLLISVLSKISVPLFFMISGALLLNKEEEPLKKQAVRFLRILAALVIFSALYYTLTILRGEEAFNILRFFRVLIEEYWMSAYWYLYAYLAFLLTLPFLRRLAKAMKEKEFLYLLLLVLLFFGFLPVLWYLFTSKEFVLNPNFSIGWIAGMSVFYPLLGYYLENRLDIRRISGKLLAVLWAADLVCIALTCIATSRASLAAGYHVQSHLMALIPVNTAVIYLSFKKLLLLHPAKGFGGKLLQTVGDCTFGIYLFHVFFLQLPIGLVYHFFDHIAAVPLIAELLRCLEVFLFSFVLTWILKHIPVVRKLF